MAIRKPTLEEWFLKYQLHHVRNRHFHIPVALNADVTRLERHFHEKGEKPPYTPILIKALALLAVQKPHINRVVFSTFYGDRIIDPDHVTVNVPIIRLIDGKSHLSATMIRDAHQLSLAEIRDRIRTDRDRPVDELPIARFVTRRRNVFWNRWMLKVLHFLIFNFPGLYEKRGGGGLSVSSLMNLQGRAEDVRPHAFGITAFTLCASNVVEVGNGRKTLKIGVGYDHYAFPGNEAVDAIQELGRILSGENPALLDSLSSSSAN